MEILAKKHNAPVFKVNYKDPFKAIIFTVLSSRTKDNITIKATRRLFRKYKNADMLVRANVREIEKLIYPVGFYRKKARNIIEIAKLVIKWGIPKTYKELLRLPGVGRKTANVVLANVFGKNVIGVDTHVHRICNRIGIVRTNNINDTEKRLEKIIEVKEMKKFNKIIVGYGQTICIPINPKCENCIVKKVCYYYKNYLNIKNKKTYG